MNQITFPRVSYDGSILKKDDLEDWYTHQVEKTIKDNLKVLSKKMRRKKMSAEKSILKVITENLHRILLTSPTTVNSIISTVNPDGISLRSRVKKTKKSIDFGTALLKAFGYERFRNTVLVELAEKLNVKTCPYCNMHYTLFAESDGNRKPKRITRFQFDHFFDKATYPYLSMSLYNLIPSCAVCNQGKSTSQLSLRFHPYVSSIAEQFYFEVAFPLSLYWGGKDRIDISLIKGHLITEKELNDYDTTFQISALYGRQRDVVKEVFDKAYMETYYAGDFFSFLGGNGSADMKRLFYGTYMDKESIEKRPMSKFIQDIRRQALS